MASPILPRLFSNSGLHFCAHMTLKAFALVLLLCALAGCGGTVKSQNTQAPSAVPTPTPAPTLTSAQVFNNVAQTWEFVSHCQNLNSDGSRGPYVEAHTWIQVNPVDATHSSWHYTKDQPCAYWMVDGIDVSSDLFLEQDTTGAWYSTGGHITAPYGYPWEVTPVPHDFTYDIATNPGMPRPYLIIPAQSSAVTVSMITTFFDTQGPNTPWETDSVTASVSTPVYSGWAMDSIQTEGGVLIDPVTIKCSTDDAKTGCAHESWLMGADGRGLQKVIPFTAGGPPLDPLQTLIRVN
jgi:hypothetical protein